MRAAVPSFGVAGPIVPDHTRERRTMATNYGPGKGESPIADAALAGEVSERATDEAEDERLEGLPEHERDADTSVGGGMTRSGVMAEKRDAGGEQPFESDDAETDADR